MDKLYGHRNTDGLSGLGKRIINSCPKAYVNEWGQVIDPCHVWFSEPSEPMWIGWDMAKDEQHKDSDNG